MIQSALSNGSLLDFSKSSYQKQPIKYSQVAILQQNYNNNIEYFFNKGICEQKIKLFTIQLHKSKSVSKLYFNVLSVDNIVQLRLALDFFKYMTNSKYNNELENYCQYKNCSLEYDDFRQIFKYIGLMRWFQ